MPGAGRPGARARVRGRHCPPRLRSSADPPDPAPPPTASSRSSTATETRIPPASSVARVPPFSSAAIRPSQPPFRLRARSPSRHVRGVGRRPGPVPRRRRSGRRPSVCSARATAASIAGAVTVSRSSRRRTPATSSLSPSTSRSASARAARTASSRSRRALRRSSSAVRSASVARSSAARARSTASAISLLLGPDRRERRLERRLVLGQPARARRRRSRRAARAAPRSRTPASRPGRPIVSRYVGDSVSRSNSTDALRAAGVSWA